MKVGKLNKGDKRRSVTVGGEEMSLNQAERYARSLRSDALITEGGEQMTHFMVGPEPRNIDGKDVYVVYPSVAPNPETGSYEGMSVDDATQDMGQAMDRGEAFIFSDPDVAMKFAFGSWKKGEGKNRKAIREGMRSYRMSKKA